MHIYSLRASPSPTCAPISTHVPQAYPASAPTWPLHGLRAPLHMHTPPHAFDTLGSSPAGTVPGRDLIAEPANWCTPPVGYSHFGLPGVLSHSGPSLQGLVSKPSWAIRQMGARLPPSRLTEASPLHPLGAFSMDILSPPSPGSGGMWARSTWWAVTLPSPHTPTLHRPSAPSGPGSAREDTQRPPVPAVSQPHLVLWGDPGMALGKPGVPSTQAGCAGGYGKETRCCRERGA